MNIFILDSDPVIAAAYHADIHLSKMILESAQMLSTAAFLLVPDQYELYKNTLYKPTHLNHPCSIWVRESFNNVIWLRDLCWELQRQRNKTRHKSLEVISLASALLFTNGTDEFKSRKLTTFALAVPLQFYSPSNPIGSYRAYYKSKKSTMPMNYKNRTIPDFMKD